MSTKKKKAVDKDKPSTLDRLTSLRHEITGESAITALIDIMIDEMGGDSTDLPDEPEDESVIDEE